MPTTNLQSRATSKQQSAPENTPRNESWPTCSKTIIKLRNDWKITKDGYESLGRLYLLYNILKFTTSFLFLDRATSLGLSTTSGRLDTSCDTWQSTCGHSLGGLNLQDVGNLTCKGELANQSHHCHQCNFFDCLLLAWTLVPFWLLYLTSYLQNDLKIQVDVTYL